MNEFPIEILIKYSRGFLVGGGTDCTVLQFESHNGDPKNPFKLLDNKIQVIFLI